MPHSAKSGGAVYGLPLSLMYELHTMYIRACACLIFSAVCFSVCGFALHHLYVVGTVKEGVVCRFRAKH